MGSRERSGGVINNGVSFVEREIGYQGIGERVIGERENFDMSDQEVIKINNTQ